MEWIRTSLATPRGRLILVLAVVALAAAVAVALVFARGTPSTPPATTGSPTSSPTAPATSTATPTRAPSPSPTVPPFTHFGILDGVGMTSAEWDARKDLLPLAVMFDSSEQAFPQAGLANADLIYEAFVEGGITRLMAVYWRQEAAYLEPIRSARTPFVIWAAELGALYAHAGGASTDNDADAIGQIAQWGVRDLNAFGPIADEFYRDIDRQAPHDLASSTAMLREGAARMGFAGPPTVAPWLFRDAPVSPGAGIPAQGVEIDFGARRSQWQTMQYRWDPATSSYARYQYGGPHLDARTKEPLRFTTVIAMRAPFVVVDDIGHVLVEEIGSGKATVFTDGVAIDATWTKTDRAARTRFFAAGGAEIQFARGPIFIEVIGPASSVIVTARADELPELPPYVPPPPYVATPEPAPAATPVPTATAIAGDTPLPTPPVATKTVPPTAAVTTSPGSSPSATSPAPPTASPGSSPSATSPAQPTASPVPP